MSWYSLRIELKCRQLILDVAVNISYLVNLTLLAWFAYMYMNALLLNLENVEKKKKKDV